MSIALLLSSNLLLSTLSCRFCKHASYVGANLSTKSLTCASVNPPLFFLSCSWRHSYAHLQSPALIIIHESITLLNTDSYSIKYSLIGAKYTLASTLEISDSNSLGRSNPKHHPSKNTISVGPLTLGQSSRGNRSPLPLHAFLLYLGKATVVCPSPNLSLMLFNFLIVSRANGKSCVPGFPRNVNRGFPGCFFCPRSCCSSRGKYKSSKDNTTELSINVCNTSTNVDFPSP